MIIVILMTLEIKKYAATLSKSWNVLKFILKIQYEHEFLKGL